MKKIFMNLKNKSYLIAILALAARLGMTNEHSHQKINPHGKTDEIHEHKNEMHHDEEGSHTEENHDEKNHKNTEHSHNDNEETETKNVGPQKGITTFDEKLGFALSEEAMKTFSVQTLLLSGSGPWEVPISALLLTGEEKNLYRVRNKLIKRIDIKILEKKRDRSTIYSQNLMNGDSVVIKGVGFIRIAEVDVTSGESGHHH